MQARNSIYMYFLVSWLLLRRKYKIVFEQIASFLPLRINERDRYFVWNQ